MKQREMNKYKGCINFKLIFHEKEIINNLYFMLNRFSISDKIKKKKWWNDYTEQVTDNESSDV